MATDSPGQRFRQALDQERPLQIAGAINAYCAKLAERAGFRALYLSGAGVANASKGLPDLGVTTRGDVAEDARRITAAVDTPLLVDCDTGWGAGSEVSETVREMCRAGVAAIHLEDQVEAKRCGHRPGKRLVPTAAMVDRLKAALDGRLDDRLVIIARTDAVASEGLQAALDRAHAYLEAGADGIFAEALEDAAQFQQFAASLPAPLLANMTEFGRSPLLTLKQLREAGIRMALYPLTAFRAMSAAADRAYRVLREQGTQASLLDSLQTRDELYEVLDYYRHERQLDEDSSDSPPGAES